MVRGVQRRHAMPWRDERTERPVGQSGRRIRAHTRLIYWVSAAESRTGPDRKHAIHPIHPSGRARAHLGWEAISHTCRKKNYFKP